MPKKLFYLSIFLLFSNVLFSQQLPLINGFDLRDFLNPASRDNYYLIYGDDGENGNWDGLTLSGVFRRQWLGLNIKGAPMTSGVKVSGAIDNFLFWGGGILYDEVGPFNNGKLFLKFGINLLSESDNASLNLGVGLFGGRQSAIRRTSLSINDQMDPLYIGSQYFEASSYATPSVGIQGHFSLGNTKILLGGGVSHLGRDKLSKVFELVPHYYGQAGVLFGEDNIFELSGKLIYAEPIWYKNYQIKYHRELSDKYFQLLTLGLGYVENTVQVEVSSLILEGELRIGFVVDIFRPSFKNISPLSSSLEVQASWYLWNK